MTTSADLERFVSARGGAAHTSDAREHGFSARTIAAAVVEDRVRRVRRSWLISRTCDLSAHRAIAVGGRLTCVTAASRLGLWVPDSAGIHVGVPRTASRLASEGLVLHWASAPMPVPRHDVVDSPVNILFHVSRCLALPGALAVWESAIRKGLVDPSELERIRWRSTAAQRLAEVASTLSDSGIETRFVHLMRTVGLCVRQQVRIDGHPVDGLIGARLIVQIDGLEHHQAADRRRDLRADARLVLRGYTVLRFDWYQVLFCPDEVIAAVGMAVAQGRHLDGQAVPGTGDAARTGRFRVGSS